VTLVHDPFDIIADPSLPFIAEALDPDMVQHVFHRHLAVPDDGLALQAIRVVRHKMGRRCLIEYDMHVQQVGTSAITTLLGKVRARGVDKASYELHTALWNTGWSDSSADGISVPQALGAVPAWHMWLQHKVPGTVATQLLAGTNGVMVAKRVAHAAHKLHSAHILPRRQHTMADEVHVLHQRLAIVAEQHPHWQSRLRHVLGACARLEATIAPPRACGIHRDFYADQVLVHGDRLYLIDLDMYCEGDPGLDIGNFIAHITEWSLRMFGDPDALADRESMLEECFVELAGESVRPSIHAYTTLTLVRHIWISTLFEDRQSFTAALLDLCEQRLARYLR
jgi:hypothetical protein